MFGLIDCGNWVVQLNLKTNSNNYCQYFCEGKSDIRAELSAIAVEGRTMFLNCSAFSRKVFGKKF